MMCSTIHTSFEVNQNKVAQDVHDDDEYKVSSICYSNDCDDSPVSNCRFSDRSFSYSNGFDSAPNSEIDQYRAQIRKLNSEAEIKALSVNNAALLKEKEDYISRISEENSSLKQDLIKILDGYVKKLVEFHDLDATKQIKKMIIEDPKLANGLEPLVFERLVEILVDNNNESTKGSAACILAFAEFNKFEFGGVLKESATNVLVKLMSDDRDTISIPVLRTLTRWAYFSADDAKMIIKNGASEHKWDIWGFDSVQECPRNGFTPETKTIVQKVTDVRGFICVKHCPCKIIVNRAAFFDAKRQLVRQFIAMDIFNGKVFKATFPLSGNCVVPIVTLTDYQLVDISEEDSHVTLLDDKGYVRKDLKLPTDKDLLFEIKFEFAVGKDVFVSVASAMGKEQIIAARKRSLLQRYY